MDYIPVVTPLLSLVGTLLHAYVTYLGLCVCLSRFRDHARRKRGLPMTPIPTEAL